MVTIEILPPNPNNQIPRHWIQTDDMEQYFSKSFTENFIATQRQKSQKANSIFTNDIFTIIHIYISTFDTKEPFYESPLQRTRYSKVKEKFISLHDLRLNPGTTYWHRDFVNNKNRSTKNTSVAYHQFFSI